MTYFAAAARRAQDMTVKSAQCPAGRAARGFIQPLAETDTEKLRLRTRAGVVNGKRYLLLAGPEALLPGETEVTLVCGDETYALLRAEAVRGAGGAVGHWEGVLCLKGETEDV